MASVLEAAYSKLLVKVSRIWSQLTHKIVTMVIMLSVFMFTIHFGKNNV